MLDKRITFGGEVIPAWIASAPKIIRPQRKMKVTPIAGTNKEVVEMEDAWESYDQPYTMFAGNGSENVIQPIMDEVARIVYKEGYQVLMDDYDTDHFRLAYYRGPFDVENRYTRAGKFDLVFRCRPERFLLSGNTEVQIGSGNSIFNPTSNNSKPLIHVVCSGDGILTVNGTTIELSDIGDYINLDCERMDAYRLPVENMNSHMTGEFPVLKSGNNLVSFSGGITEVVITPKWWTI